MEGAQGAVPPDAEEGREPGALRASRRPGGGSRRLRQLLQLPALPQGLGNVTPSDVLKGRREEILARRKEVQTQTIQRRRRHNKALRELTKPPSGT